MSEQVEGAAAAGGGKGSKVKLAVGVVVLLLLGGGAGFGGAMALGMAGGAAAAEGGEHGEEAGGHGEEAGGHGEEAGGHGEEAGGHGEAAGGHGEEAGGHGEAAGGHGEAAGGHGEPAAGGHGEAAPAGPVLPKRGTVRSVVNLGTFTVNLRGSGGGRVLRTEVQVEVDGADQLVVDEKKPVLRDAVISLASDYTFADLEGIDGKTHLRDELLGRLNSVTSGKPEVGRVYFTEFVVQ